LRAKGLRRSPNPLGRMCNGLASRTSRNEHASGPVEVAGTGRVASSQGPATSRPGTPTLRRGVAGAWVGRHGRSREWPPPSRPGRRGRAGLLLTSLLPLTRDWRGGQAPRRRGAVDLG
jgi:hypothetical protein